MSQPVAAMLADQENLLAMYLRLADASRRRMSRAATARLLVLAANTASDLGLDDVAEFCRSRVLSDYPQHLVGHYATMRAARCDPQFMNFIRALARHYTPERSEHLLATLGIEMGRERDVYADMREYAAALLGTTIDAFDTAPTDGPAALAPANPYDPPQSNEVAPARLARDPARQPPSPLGNMALLAIVLAALIAGVIALAIIRGLGG